MDSNVVSFWNFKLWLLLDQKIQVWNVKGLRHWVPKILGLENQSLWQRVNSFLLIIFFSVWARDLKNSGKYGSGRSCRWVLSTTWAFGFKLHLIFHRVELKKNTLNIEPYSPPKPTKVGFIFIGSNRAEDLAAVNYVTQAVVRVGSKIGP